MFKDLNLGCVVFKCLLFDHLFGIYTSYYRLPITEACLTWVNPRRNGHWAVGFHVFFDPESQNHRAGSILEHGNVSWWYHLPKQSTFSETVWWYLCLVPDLYKELTKKSDDTIRHPHSRHFLWFRRWNFCVLFCWRRFLLWAYDDWVVVSNRFLCSPLFGEYFQFD